MASKQPQRGVTYLEMLATVFIMMILASAILPLARVAHKRQQEIELRRALREVRTAIDRFHSYAKPTAGQPQLIGGTEIKYGSEGYPADLETLVKGVSQVGMPGKKMKFLRRIPVDPMTGTTEWGLRCIQDEPTSTSWCGENVWDIYTKSEAKALDGTPYKEW